MTWIRVAVVALIGLAIGASAIPILVLIDLLSGGSGWGLCPAGLGACDNPYTTAPELAALLTLALLAPVVGLRLLMRVARSRRVSGRE